MSAVQALFATVYVTVVYFITQQPPDTLTYLKVVLIYILVTIVADGVGVLMGTLLNPVVSWLTHKRHAGKSKAEREKTLTLIMD